MNLKQIESQIVVVRTLFGRCFCTIAGYLPCFKIIQLLDFWEIYSYVQRNWSWKSLQSLYFHDDFVRSIYSICSPVVFEVPVVSGEKIVDCTWRASFFFEKNVHLFLAEVEEEKKTLFVSVTFSQYTLSEWQIKTTAPQCLYKIHIWSSLEEAHLVEPTNTIGLIMLFPLTCVS